MFRVMFNFSSANASIWKKLKCVFSGKGLTSTIYLYDLILDVTPSPPNITINLLKLKAFTGESFDKAISNFSFFDNVF